MVSGRLPQSTWATFVHELTHHWCFTSPVGEALTSLYLRPILAHLESAAATDDKLRRDAGIEYVTYDMTAGLLWPIIEGMALLSEFDVIPSRQVASYSF